MQLPIVLCSADGEKMVHLVGMMDHIAIISFMHNSLADHEEHSLYEYSHVVDLIKPKALNKCMQIMQQYLFGQKLVKNEYGYFIVFKIPFLMLLYMPYFARLCSTGSA